MTVVPHGPQEVLVPFVVKQSPEEDAWDGKMLLSDVFAFATSDKLFAAAKSKDEWPVRVPVMPVEKVF